MRQIVLLRGINLGPHNRIAMPALRELLTDAGYREVQTYVQSGNIVVETRKAAATVADECARLIAERFGLDIPVVTRTAAELAEVVRRNPLGDATDDPKRYQVSFLSAKPDPAVVAKVAALAVGDERFAAVGRELYAWHPAGVARSKLAVAVAGKALGVTATARNWTTVEALLALAAPTDT
ncbi:MAG TPA: DUF1697 domain-containing protein [Gaiellales bacterium]|jgi:uncharacterized protein (DUF1697 family)